MTEKEEDLGEPTKSIPMDGDKFDIFADHGCCRDLYCLIIFLATIVAMFVLFFYGFHYGDPTKLIMPLNSQGCFCGKEADACPFANEHYLYRMNLTDSKTDTCVSKCPGSDYRCIHADGIVGNETEGNCLSPDTFAMTTRSILWRCVPDGESATGIDVASFFNGKAMIVISDLKNAWWILFLAFVFALVISFLWLCFIQFMGACVVWTAIIICLLLLLLVGLWIFIYGLVRLKDSDKLLSTENTNTYVIIGIGAVILLCFIIAFCVVIAMRKKILLACELIGQAAMALRRTWGGLISPCAAVGVEAVVVVLLLVTLVYYMSTLELKIDGGQRSIVSTANTNWIIAFVLIVFVWVSFFLVGANDATIAGAGAAYYFTRKEEDLATFPTLQSFGMFFFHHMGSVSVGSFLMALVCLLRAVVFYLQKKVSEQTGEGKNVVNCAVKCCLACCACCLSCLQKILGIITHRAYIMMMIHGKSFFPSAYNAMKLMLRNALRTIALNGVSNCLILTGVFTITFLSGLICLLIIHPEFVGGHSAEGEKVIVTWWLIALLCFIVAFAVAWIVIGVLKTMMDTIFLCFLQDEEMAKTNGSSYIPYADKALVEHMDLVKNKSDAMVAGEGVTPTVDQPQKGMHESLLTKQTPATPTYDGKVAM